MPKGDVLAKLDGEQLRAALKVAQAGQAKAKVESDVAQKRPTGADLEY